MEEIIMNKVLDKAEPATREKRPSRKREALAPVVERTGGRRRRGARIVGLVLGALAGVAVVAAASVATGNFLFERQVSGEVAALFAKSEGVRPSLLTEADIAGLPAPVQRWLRHSQVLGKERPLTVRLKQEGRIRLEAGQGWLPYTAEEYYTTDPPGFVWFADVRMAPLLSVAGRDLYYDGRGSMDIRLLSLVRMVDAKGPALDQGALLRYLNETMWFPAAAVSPYIAWEGVDARSARATMSYGGVSAWAIFHFDEEGRLTSMVADRYSDVGGGQSALTPWETPIFEYGEFNGVRMPVVVGATWKQSSGDFDYIRARITAIEYSRAALY
jgi:hypothetical protein